MGKAFILRYVDDLRYFCRLFLFAYRLTRDTCRGNSDRDVLFLHTQATSTSQQSQSLTDILVFCGGNMAVSLWLGLFLTSSALACSVCGYTSPDSQFAFILTTILLTFVPLLFIGGVVYYLKRKREGQ